MEHIDMGLNFFIVDALMEDDRTRIITARLWRLGTHPLRIRTWVTNFAVDQEVKSRTTTFG